MSLFADQRYQWRERYFVLLERRQRPLAEDVRAELAALDNRYRITELLADDAGRFRSLTLQAPNDFAAMDICYVAGEEVIEQAVQMAEELQDSAKTSDERKRITRLVTCNARLDIDHFEQVVVEDADSPALADVLEDDEPLEEFLDPGTLLRVIRRLTKLCHGVAIDPQAGDFV